MITVNAIQCPECNDIIYSRARHDFHRCSCGNCFIDGGREYSRIGAKDLSTLKHLSIELDVSDDTLYNDWNKSIDKYGIIKSTT